MACLKHHLLHASIRLDRERIPGSIGTNIINVENKVVDEIGQ